MLRGYYDICNLQTSYNLKKNITLQIDMQNSTLKKKKTVGINEQVKQAERQIMGAILGHSNVCFVHAKVV